MFLGKSYSEQVQHKEKKHRQNVHWLNIPSIYFYYLNCHIHNSDKENSYSNAFVSFPPFTKYVWSFRSGQRVSTLCTLWQVSSGTGLHINIKILLLHLLYSYLFYLYFLNILYSYIIVPYYFKPQIMFIIRMDHIYKVVDTFTRGMINSDFKRIPCSFRERTSSFGKYDILKQQFPLLAFILHLWDINIMHF